MLRIVLVFISVLVSTSAYAQSFSCPIGKRAACLDYNDNVCDGWNAKCVKKDAQCFDSYTCGYKGFVCKDKLDNAIDEYENIRSQYNTLVNDYNSIKKSRDSLKDCITYASTLEDARRCSY